MNYKDHLLSQSEYEQMCSKYGEAPIWQKPNGMKDDRKRLKSHDFFWRTVRSWGERKKNLASKSRKILGSDDLAKKKSK